MGKVLPGREKSEEEKTRHKVSTHKTSWAEGAPWAHKLVAFCGPPLYWHFEPWTECTAVGGGDKIIRTALTVSLANTTLQLSLCLFSVFFLWIYLGKMYYWVSYLRWQVPRTGMEKSASVLIPKIHFADFVKTTVLTFFTVYFGLRLVKRKNAFRRTPPPSTTGKVQFYLGTIVAINLLKLIRISKDRQKSSFVCTFNKYIFFLYTIITQTK